MLMLCVIMLSVTMKSIMLNVILPSVVMLNVVEPLKLLEMLDYGIWISQVIIAFNIHHSSLSISGKESKVSQLTQGHSRLEH